MSDSPTPLREEIRQSRPFRSPSEEAFLGLLRTTDVLRRRIGACLESQGITAQQYNVLRILRGAHPEPLPTLEIGSRLIEEAPGITRLIDRLEAKGWVLRERCRQDRRRVDCRISESGLALVARLDAPLLASIEQAFRDIEPDRLTAFVAVLDELRAAARGAAAPAGGG